MTSDGAYGTFSADSMPDLERWVSHDHARSRQQEKHIAMRPLADEGANDSPIESDDESLDSAQAGVKRAEAIASTWTKTGLYVAYIGIALLAFATSLENQTTTNLTIFATSSFSSHSLVATVGVVQGVVMSVAKPPMSKVADVFGRFEAFTLSILIYVIGYIQQASSSSVGAYAAAQLCYSAGQTGLQILIMIFIADTSDLLNRALISKLPDVPFLVNIWIGPRLAQSILTTTGWRWGYGIWAVIIPVAFLPLAVSLAVNQRRAAKNGLIPRSQFEGLSSQETLLKLWYDLDVMGLVLICAAFSLILIPLTLGSSAGWGNVSLIAMLAVGCGCLFAFPFWERSKTLAPKAFFPRSLLHNRSVIAGMAIAFFYFMAFYLSVYPYFQSYLLVVQGLSVTTAGRIVQIFTFMATVTGLIVSLLIKHVRRYRIFVTLGSVVYVLGLALMIRYRTQESSLVVIAGTQILIGVGGGMLNVPTQLGVQASASHQEVGAATALFLTLLEIGGAVGNAISGAIWTSNVPQKLAMYLPSETQDQAKAIYGNVSFAATGWPMDSPTRVAINQAYQETMTKILTVAVIVALPCIVLSFFMEDYKLDEIDQGVKGMVVGGVQESADRRESEALAEPSGRSSVDSDDMDRRDSVSRPLFDRYRKDS